MLHNIPQVCAALNIGRTNAYALLESGKLPSVKIGRRRLVRDEDLKKYIAALPLSVSKEA